MLQIYLARHGATSCNERQLLCGSGCDVELSTAGAKMAEELAAQHSGQAVVAVISSPQARALASATPLARAYGVEPQIDQRLKEIDYGEWDGLADSQIESSALAAFRRDERAAPDGETLSDVAARAVASIEAIREKHDDGIVWVFSHKTTLRTLLCSLLDVPLRDYRRWQLEPGSVTILDCKGRRIALHTGPESLAATRRSVHWVAIAAATLFMAGYVVATQVALSREAALEVLRDTSFPAGLQLWAHRAVSGDGASAEEVGRAVKAGYTGIELDVRWHNDVLVVAHDPLTPGSTAPLLNDVFKAAGDPLYYWLDLKALDTTSAEAIGVALRQTLADTDIAKRCFVESDDMDALLIIRRQVPEIRLIIRLSAMQQLRPLPPYLMLLDDLLTHRIDAVSLHHSAIGRLAIPLAPLLVMTYTVNDAQTLATMGDHGVDVVLTDSLAPPRAPPP